MFDFNKKFIALGIEYTESGFKPLVNRKLYKDPFFPPTKPIEGGLWGAEYNSDDRYVSSWQKYIYETLSPTMFEHRLNSKSTLFTINENAKVAAIESFKDIRIEMNDTGSLTSNLNLRTVKTIGSQLKDKEKLLFVDFEKLGDEYDALYVSMNFINQVDWLLNDAHSFFLQHNISDIRVAAELLFKAQIFEDWNVDSILVLNNNCINVLDVKNF